MGFKTAIQFGGGSAKNEAFFVNDGVVTKAEIGYDIAPFAGWETTENLVLRIEVEQDGLKYPVRLTAFGSYKTEEVEKEVTKGRGKAKTTEIVKTTKINGMGSAFRVLQVIQEACDSGQVKDEIEVSPTGEIIVNGTVLAPDEAGGVVDFPSLEGVRLFYVRYKAKRGSSTGYNVHRRFLTYREGEDNGEAAERVKADFIKQVKGGWIKDYVGDIPDDTAESSQDDEEELPF